MNVRSKFSKVRCHKQHCLVVFKIDLVFHIKLNNELLLNLKDEMAYLKVRIYELLEIFN